MSREKNTRTPKISGDTLLFIITICKIIVIYKQKYSSPVNKSVKLYPGEPVLMIEYMVRSAKIEQIEQYHVYRRKNFRFPHITKNQVAQLPVRNSGKHL